MKHKRRGLKAHGLSLLAAVGLMAFGAAEAQPAEFLAETELGVFEEFNEIPLESHPVVGELEENEQLTIDGLGIAITCSGLKILGGTASEGAVIHGRFLYTDCTVLSSSLSLEEVSNCAIRDEINLELGRIATDELSGLPFAHSGELYYLVEASSGVFTKVEIEGSLCPAKGLYTVTGTKVYSVKSSHSLNLLISPTVIIGLFSDTIKFGNRTALITAGVADIHLASGGPYADKNWGIKK